MQTRETADIQERHEQAGARGVRGYVGLAGSTARREVAVRSSGEAWPSAHDEHSGAALVERLRSLQPAAPHLIGGHRRARTAGGGGARAGRAVGGAGQCAPGARFRHGHRTLGQRLANAWPTLGQRLAKTAAVEAAVRAHVAAALQPTPRRLPDAATPARAARPALGARRHQVVTRLTAEQNRRQQARPAGPASGPCQGGRAQRWA
jgi:hypothetical protein